MFLVPCYRLLQRCIRVALMFLRIDIIDTHLHLFRIKISDPVNVLQYIAAEQLIRVFTLVRSIENCVYFAESNWLFVYNYMKTYALIFLIFSLQCVFMYIILVKYVQNQVRNKLLYLTDIHLFSCCQKALQLVRFQYCCVSVSRVNKFFIAVVNKYVSSITFENVHIYSEFVYTNNNNTTLLGIVSRNRSIFFRIVLSPTL